MKTRLFLLVLLLCGACNRDEHLGESATLGSDSFVELYASMSSESKGELVVYPEDMGSMGVFCAHTGDQGWRSDLLFEKLNDRRYDVSSDGQWSSEEGSVSWDYESLSDLYTFFAYSPHSEEAKGASVEIKQGELVIEYSVPRNSTRQSDLMLARPHKDVSPQGVGVVSLLFFHTLASVSFGVVTTTDVRITDIEMTGVCSGGTLEWDYTENMPCWTWIDTSTKNFSVDMDEEYTLDEQNSARVNSDQGYLLMIPQTLDEGATVTLSLSTKETRTLTIPAGTVWEAGSKYHYVVQLEEDGCSFIYTSKQTSNCYMIQPTEGEETMVQIPIEDRINDFWLNYSGKGAEKIFSDTDTLAIQVSKVWDDFSKPIDLDYRVVRDSDGKMAVQIFLPESAQEGNLLFSVDMQDNSNSWLPVWSWHLWVTDYNPDAIAAQYQDKIEAGVDRAYELDDYSGAVHRYEDADGMTGSSAVWSGIYEDKFMMDRNIGERSLEYRDANASCYGAGSLYYQYGRKDPLPGTVATYESGASGPVYRAPPGGGYFYVPVEIPQDFYYGSGSTYNWCTETDARLGEYIWYDHDIPADGYKAGKSIFDPSPLGWCVPVADTWSSFEGSEIDQASCDDDSDDPLVGVYGLYGYRDAGSQANLTEGGEVGYVWSANKSSTYGYGYALYYSPDKICTPHESYLSNALPVRAIQE